VRCFVVIFQRTIDLIVDRLALLSLTGWTESFAFILRIAQSSIDLLLPMRC